MAIDGQEVSGGFVSAMPRFRKIIGERDDAVGEKDFGGNIRHVGGDFVVESA